MRFLALHNLGNAFLFSRTPVMRSKGFMWLSSSHTTAYYWSHAGQHFEIRDEGDWWAAVPSEDWPGDAGQADIIMQVRARGNLKHLYPPMFGMLSFCGTGASSPGRGTPGRRTSSCRCARVHARMWVFNNTGVLQYA